MDATYEAALEASRVAYAKFAKVTEAYRAREIDDAEYLAARAEYAEAEKTFDAAYAVAATLTEVA